MRRASAMRMEVLQWLDIESIYGGMRRRVSMRGRAPVCVCDADAGQRQHAQHLAAGPVTASASTPEANMSGERVAQARVRRRCACAGAVAPARLDTRHRTRMSARRFNARSVPTNDSTNASAGRARMASGVSYCTSAPSRRIAMRSPIRIASSMSWVTKTIVFCNPRRILQELVLQPRARDRVDRAERLVHQHHRRVGRERARDADALLLAARQLAGKAVAIGAGSMPTSASNSSTRAAIRASSQPRSRGTVAMFCGDRPVRKEADLLDHVADAAPQARRDRSPSRRARHAHTCRRRARSCG